MKTELSILAAGTWRTVQHGGEGIASRACSSEYRTSGGGSLYTLSRCAERKGMGLYHDHLLLKLSSFSAFVLSHNSRSRVSWWHLSAA